MVSRRIFPARPGDRRKRNRRNPGQENNVSEGPGKDIEGQFTVFPLERMMKGEKVIVGETPEGVSSLQELSPPI